MADNDPKRCRYCNLGPHMTTDHHRYQPRDDEPQPTRSESLAMCGEPIDKTDGRWWCSMPLGHAGPHGGEPARSESSLTAEERAEFEKYLGGRDGPIWLAVAIHAALAEKRKLESHGPEGHNVTNAQWVALLQERDALEKARADAISIADKAMADAETLRAEIERLRKLLAENEMFKEQIRALLGKDGE